MTAFSPFRGTAVPLDLANVDTDQIIPKQFLTAVTRKGFGKHLFHDWRYLDKHEQQPNPDFVLNKPQYKGASILLTRENFGCGSSREHAPWALSDYGFKVIIADSFADIFYANCINNQMLPVRLPSDALDQLFATVMSEPQTQLDINLSEQVVTCGNHNFTFTIAEHHKTNLLKGLDSIGQTLQQAKQIEVYEQQRAPWL